MSEKQKQALEKLGKIIEKLDDESLKTLLSIGDGIAIGMDLNRGKDKKAG